MRRHLILAVAVLALMAPTVSASASDSTGGYQSCPSGTTVWIYSEASQGRHHYWTPNGSYWYPGMGFAQNNTGRTETSWQVTTNGTIFNAGASCVPSGT